MVGSGVTGPRVGQSKKSSNNLSNNPSNSAKGRRSETY